MRGSDPALLCALKSIPTYSMEAAEMPNAEQVRFRWRPLDACGRVAPSVSTLTSTPTQPRLRVDARVRFVWR